MPLTGFRLEHTDPATGARAGMLSFGALELPTPVFMPVGTQGTVKSVSPEEVKEIGSQLILANTYHLLERPGAEILHAAGGLKRFMGWDSAILTDSGGFQVFSLGGHVNIDDEGVSFRSPKDGGMRRLTPASVVGSQSAFGVDIMMPLDQPVAPGATHEATVEAMRRTTDWLLLSKSARAELSARGESGGAGALDQPGPPGGYVIPDALPALFGISQGGFDEKLRAESARQVAALELPGYAVGGLSFGEERAMTFELTAVATAELPVDKPRYFMGIGDPLGLLEVISAGIDMFDCVLPTRLARNGAFFCGWQRLNIKNAVHTTAMEPLEAGCDCYSCQRFSRAYIRHLVQAGELLAHRLMTIHNLRHLVRLMQRTRQAIIDGTFGTLLAEARTAAVAGGAEGASGE